ncbi:FecR domain-containing protein [Asticcacaulis sp. SL142]|uniref:FecR family protein n=1 Tax=Asticcacaulis sp. SL142 TaxID=2995155 RepID=UPI00226C9A38|nr:FecR domain-containing protein [Asticcacaulis sp. SL142]WAC48005.1 FecR domain-containing protein [Asticcacaulis sp. SL142]
MIRVVNEPNLLSVEDEAAAWVVAMMAETVQAHTERQFELWIKAHPDHAQAYADMCATWHAAPVEDALTVKRQQCTSRRFMGVVVGGALAACLVLGFVGLNTKTLSLTGSAKPQYSASLMTGPGDIQDVALPDGTRIALSGNSALTVRFDRGVRQVNLTRGEAFFDVAHEANRPFQIAANAAQVVVLGTAFNIDLPDDKATEISVYRGKVQVEAGGQVNRLSVGQKLISRGSGVVRETFEASEAPDWREGWYEAEDVPLKRLIAEVNRFSKIPVEIGDPDLAKKMVSGRFKVSDPALVLNGLTQVYGVRATQENKVIVLTN